MDNTVPDRVIRDELLTSERYWACSPEARCLFVSILLSADDAARYSGAPFALRTKCMAGTVSHERIEAILGELVDADLVRRYVSAGKPYLFVPRFGNRKRYIASSKYPAPPPEINDIVLKKSDSSQTQVRPKTDSGLPQDSHARAGVGVGEERRKTNPAQPDGFAAFWKAWPTDRRKVAKLQCLAKWRNDGLEAQASAIVAHVEAMKRSRDWMKNDGEFIPAPLVYLNQARYEAPTPATETEEQARQRRAQQAIV